MDLMGCLMRVRCILMTACAGVVFCSSSNSVTPPM